MKDEGYKIRDEYGVYYLTFAVVEWIDVFSRKIYADIVLDSLKFCIEKKQLKVFAWCIMTNHVHLILKVIFPVHYAILKNLLPQELLMQL